MHTTHNDKLCCNDCFIIFEFYYHLLDFKMYDTSSVYCTF